MGKSQDLYEQAKKLIPGGTQLLSKRPELFLPDLWPAYYKKAEGCEIWDLDDKKYVDCSYMGVGSCILGYADSDVNAAVKKAVDSGSMTTLNVPEEVDLANLLIGLHPWAKMVRYARTGGEAMALAIRAARTASGKDKVLFCGYHGWHDWYLAANLADDKSLDGHLLPGLSPKGVARALQATAIPFKYNDTQEFLGLIKKYRTGIGVIVLEAIRNIEPQKEFIESVQEKAKEVGAVIVVDEVTSGWRLNIGGAHLLFGLEPDIAVFAKGISNGFPMAVVIGKKEVMDSLQETFVSSTYWTEKIGPTAAIATIKKIRKFNIPKHLKHIGKKVKDGWQILAKKNKLDVYVGGIDPLGHFAFNYEDPLVPKTLFTQEMLSKGFLATTAFYASYAHNDEHIDKYLAATDKAFMLINKALASGKAQSYLKSKVCQSGFKRLT